MKFSVGSIKTFVTWLGGLFKDERDSPSSKRFVGIMCAIALCITMYRNSFSAVEVAPAPYLVDAVALLAFGCLGLASVDKIWGKKGTDKTE